MCGIAGVIKVHDPVDGPPPPPLEAIPESWLDILDESIKHRGPDGQGRFRDRAVREDGTVVDVALVHRRLSIIDHDGGHQPMVHDGDRLRPDLTYQPGETPIIASEVEPDKSLVAVVFNGCIYNHRELRKELEGQGYVFETDHSDTEVLVHGWRARKPPISHNSTLLSNDAFNLDGMFAVGIWDRVRRAICISRDRYGEKPLYFVNKFPLQYYHEGSNTFRYEMAFSSCISGITLIDPKLVPMSHPRDYSKLTEEWIRYGSAKRVPDKCSHLLCPRTLTIQPRVPPKHTDPPSQTVPEVTRSSSLWHQSCQKHLEDAISSRLGADVPLGVFLSGGIDSALIATITHKQRPDVRAFTVRMPDTGFDESHDATETAKHIGIEHHILECDLHPADDLQLLIQQSGLPFGDSSLLPTYWVSKAARQHVKIALSGDGGDELFGGYRRYTINALLNKRSDLLKRIPYSLLGQRVPGSRSTYLARLVIAARFGGYSELLAIFPTPDIKQLIPSIEDVAKFDPVDNPLHIDFYNYLPNDLLRKTDTASMSVGLEVRCPFLDPKLAEAALRTPLDILMPNGERKGLLKQVARKYLPDHIVDRPKQGFAIPIGEWFRTDYGGMRQLLYDHLHSADPFPGLAESGVELNMKFVEQMLKEHDAAGENSINPWHGRDHSQRLYMLLVLSIWAKWLERVRTGTEQSA
ncbi:MAG: asparagine synthase (glutamine-hydrolyzing) [Phycisphaerales bacterium]|nr:asparagine synthase (glutamine-hydrolyzing) [Phycisphaerales bacterium]